MARRSRRRVRHNPNRFEDGLTGALGAMTGIGAFLLIGDLAARAFYRARGYRHDLNAPHGAGLPHASVSDTGI